MTKRLIILLLIIGVIAFLLYKDCNKVAQHKAMLETLHRMTLTLPSEDSNMVTYDTTITYSPAASGAVWQVQIHRPTNYFTTDTSSRRVIITMQGEGEVGTNTSFLTHYGPGYWLQQTRSDGSIWGGNVTLAAANYYPIFVTIMPAAANVRPNYESNLIHTLINLLHPRGHKIDFMGLSMGNQCNVWTLIDSTTTGTNTMMALTESVVDQEGENGSSYGGGYTSTFPNDMGHWAKAYGGKFLGLEGDADDRNVWQNSETMNDSMPGSAFFVYQNFGGGGHGSSGTGNDGTSIDCWNYWWDIRTTDLTSTNPYITWSYQSGTHPHTMGTYTGPPESILQWVMRQGDTTVATSGIINSKTQKWVGTLGEYTMPFVDSINRAVLFSANLQLTGNNGSGTAAVPLPISGSTQFMSTGNTLHGGGFLDAFGNVYETGGNDQGQLGLGSFTTPIQTLQQITTDSRGLPFTNVSILCGTYIQIGDTTCEGQLFVKHGTVSDTVFFAGRGDKYGMGGDGSTTDDSLTKPTLKFSLPLSGSTATRIVSLTAEEVAIAALNDGTVITWGGGTLFSSPLGRSVTGTGYASVGFVSGFNSGDSITQVVGGGAWGWIALNQHGTNLYGVGHYSGYLGNAANTVYSTPTLINTNITSHILNGGTRTYIKQIAGNSNCYHAIPNDGSLWGWGDNGMGSIGNGVEANLASPGGSSSPWFIDPGAILVLPQTLPVQVTNAYNYAYMYSGQLFCFDFGVLTTGGQLLFCGRNKGGVLPNRVSECAGDGGVLSANYPNSWDVPYLTPMTPYAGTTTIQQGNYGCYSGAVTSNCYSCGSTTSATANPGSNQTLSSGTTSISVSGVTSSSNGGSLTQYLWTQTSGPTSVIDVAASIAPNISLTGGNGTYVYNLFVQDQGFHTGNATITITVGAAAQTTFYFNTSGSDGAACTIGSPCVSVPHLNTLISNGTIATGSTVYFQSGQTFTGQIVCATSGVTFTSYGTGAMPIIGGMTSLSGWSNVSGNLWKTAYSGPAPSFLTQNGVIMPIATTPNRSTGYYIPSSMTTTTITDFTNSSTVTTGSQIIGRSSPYTIDTAVVTGVSSNVISVSPAFTYSGVGGLGWMVRNNIPDTAQEWNCANNFIEVYSLSAPTGWAVPSQDTVFYGTGNNLTLTGLDLQGGNTALAYFTSQSILLNNDSLLWARDGVFSHGASNVTVTGCTMKQMVNNAIYKQNATYNWIVTNNTIKDIGVWIGMGGNGSSGTYQGINEVQGDSAAIITGNVLDSIGYIGLSASGSGFAIDSNVISNFCQLKEDGGAIYTWIPSNVSYARSRKIVNNYIYNGGSFLSHNGLTTDYSSAACGVYLDNFSAHITVSNNTVTNVNSVSYYNHGPNNTFTGNSGYNAKYAEFLAYEFSGGPTITGLTVTGNAFGSGNSTDALVRLITVNNDLSTFGTINNNGYIHTILSAPFYMQNSGGNSYLALAGWTSALGYDAGSTLSLKTINFNGNSGSNTTSIYLGGNFYDGFGNHYAGTVTLAARSSLLLYLISSLNQLTSPVRVLFN